MNRKIPVDSLGLDGKKDSAINVSTVVSIIDVRARLRYIASPIITENKYV